MEITGSRASFALFTSWRRDTGDHRLALQGRFKGGVHGRGDGEDVEAMERGWYGMYRGILKAPASCSFK